MSIKLSTKTHGRRDCIGFNPCDLVKNFAAYTGRAERTEAAIAAMADSLLANGQEQPFLFRRGFGDTAIPVSGHTRILAAARITERCMGEYSPENPFIIYGLFRQFNEEEAIFHTFFENDDETRTPMTPIDKAQLIRHLSEQYGLNDTQIGAKLRKSSVWVAQHKTLLELDGKTQAQVASGDIAVSAAQVLTQIAPEERASVVAAATEGGKKKATARNIGNAAAATTTTRVKRSDSDFRSLVKTGTEKYGAGPRQALLFAILDFRAGKITDAEFWDKFEYAVREAAYAKLTPAERVALGLEG